MKLLIVNADDFGYSEGVNEGIVQAHLKGVVTSTSLMVYGEAVKHSIEILKKCPRLGMGLHFQILKGEEIAIATNPNNTLAELDKQTKLFIKLIGKPPDHIDSHHHIHKAPNLFPLVLKYSKKNNIPLRSDRTKLIESFYGKPNVKDISVDAAINILKKLDDEVSELMCHPGKADQTLEKISSYVKEREIELETLTSNKLLGAINILGIKLVNWSEVPTL